LPVGTPPEEMRINMVEKLMVCIVTLCCAVSSAYAGTVEQTDSRQKGNNLDLTLHETVKTAAEENTGTAPILLMAAAEEELSSKMQATDSNAASEYQDRMFTGNKIHKYLGIGSIAAALLTVLSPKEEDGPHEYFAKTSAVLGVGAVATGLGFHYEDISMAGGMKDPDNLHALWAGLGAVGIAMAAATGPDTPHATYGSLGAIGMMVGVKYTW